MNAITNIERSTFAVTPSKQIDLSPQTFEQALTFCNYLADSDLVPKDFRGKPGNCLIAMQWGSELGLKPLQALQNLAIINGRPSLWGDAVIALVRSSPACEYVIETQAADAATCKVKRRGEPEQERTFTMSDAHAAGLKGKAGPWTQYPKRMLQMRARAFALRDVFPDVLRGLPVAEELMDYPATTEGPRNMGEAIVVTPPAIPEPPIWPDDIFNTQFLRWEKAVQAGVKSIDDIVAMAMSRGTLTEAQEKSIRAIPPAAMNAAEG